VDMLFKIVIIRLDWALIYELGITV